MSKNVTIAGASYTAVPSVDIPATGGGTASFFDVSGTTATASDVAQGKVFYAADGTLTTGTASGGGGITTLVGYTDKNAYDLYADEELTTPWKEVHGWEYEELYDEMINADKFVIRQPGSFPSQYIPARIYYDPVEPEIELYIWAGNQMKFISV